MNLLHMKLLVFVKKVKFKDKRFDLLKRWIIGKAGELVERGDNTYGGKYVINPSGGLISKGHPLGATGLAQCAELVWKTWSTRRFWLSRYGKRSCNKSC